MASKRKSTKAAGRAAAADAQAQVVHTLYQIWLAGLGAVSQAQRGAPKVLAGLVKEGARIQGATRGAAEKALRGAFTDAQSALTARVGQVRGQAVEALDGLEKIFQTRVHRALTKLGVPSAEEVEMLSKRVDALNANIEKLGRTRKRAPRHHSAAKAASAASQAAA